MTVSTILPTSASRGQTVDVVITGTRFVTGVSALTLGGDVTVNSFSVTSFTQINANITVVFAGAPGADIVVNSVLVKSPAEILANITLASLAASGSRTVTATNAAPGGGSATLPARFTVGTGMATAVEGDLGQIPDHFVLQEA